MGIAVTIRGTPQFEVDRHSADEQREKRDRSEEIVEVVREFLRVLGSTRQLSAARLPVSATGRSRF